MTTNILTNCNLRGLPMPEIFISVRVIHKQQQKEKKEKSKKQERMMVVSGD